MMIPITVLLCSRTAIDIIM